MLRKMLLFGLLSASALLFSTSTFPTIARAQDDDPAPTEESKAESTSEDSPKRPPPSRNGVKPYDDVITKEAKSDPGLFFVHRLDGKVFYEIPNVELDKPMLWVTQIAGTTTGKGYAGAPAGDRVVRWEFREEEETVLLRDVNFTLRAEEDDPIRSAVEASSLEPIIKSFPVRAYGKDKAMVIDVTELFTTDIPEFTVKERVGGASIDTRRTFVQSVKSFPENIESRVLTTFSPRPRGGGSGGPGGPDGPPGGGGSGDTVTVEVHHSMVRLPDEPMKPRRFDDRVGFFTVRFEDYSADKQEVDRVQYITRWHLEKKDPEAELSEPKEPIVFYLGREIPEKWRPYVKQGIEAWQVAFEEAGFKNAIIAKEPPDPREDPDWDPEDARISSIRWLPSTIENAFGPHVHDPRSGEILEADIRMYHNVIKLARDWYFVQASPNDERAQKLPLPDDLLGELVAYVVAHEVGHSLGFPHNMKASSAYTVEQLRDPEFTEKHGIEASIMDYGRFNYVAQPGDGARLIPIVGPYDKFAVEWGYKEFPDAKSPEDEKAKLDEIVARQKDDPMLRFGNPNPGEDPSQQTEDLGSDPIAATELGLKNLERVAGYLVEATCNEGEDYSLLQNMYNQLVSQFGREMGHVANVVGGFVRNNAWFGDADIQFEAVEADRQKQAVSFLNANAFHVPDFLIQSDVLLRLEADGAADRILNSQKSLLRSLMNESRLKRMAEHVTRVEDGDAYAPLDLLRDLSNGLFEELDESNVEIDLYRRNLQRAYVELLIEQVKKESATSDLPALARGELRRLVRQLNSATSKVDEDNSPTTLYHLQDLASRITQALDPRPEVAGVNVAGAEE